MKTKQVQVTGHQGETLKPHNRSKSSKSKWLWQMEPTYLWNRDSILLRAQFGGRAALILICSCSDYMYSNRLWPFICISKPTLEPANTKNKIKKLFISVQWRENCLLTARWWWSIIMTYSWSYPLRQCQLRQISNNNLIDWGDLLEASSSTIPKPWHSRAGHEEDHKYCLRNHDI